MHIVVCIKQVPDSAQIRVHPVSNTIMRQGVPAIVNPYDLFALEEALRLKDRYGGRATVLCMGPSQADAALRKALSFGADEAILLSDRAFAGSDTLATSYALASAIQRIHEDMPVDLVFAGKQTIDGDTAQVGPGIAKRLNLQLLTYVAKIDALDLERREIVIHRRAEGGVQVLKTRLPCLVTVLEGINEMRFATMDDMFRAARYPLKVWDKAAAGIKGSPTVVAKVFAPQPKARKAERIEVHGDAPRDLAATLLTKLFAHHPQLERHISERAS
jgi:electron transfer flavoprotein beta subunit